MRRLTVFLCCWLLAHPVYGQSASQQMLISFGTVAASNILSVQTPVACTSGAGSTGSTSCTVTSTGSGNLLVYWVHAGDNTSANSVPTSSSGTWVQACTFTGGSGRATWYYMANSPSGLTSVTTHEASGNHTAGVFYEFSGVATSSPLDVCSATELNISTAAPVSPTITTTQTDIVLAATREDTSASLATHNAGKDWTGTYAPQASDGNASVVEYRTVTNGVVGNFVADFVVTSHSYRTSIISFKSAVAGSAPSGNSVQAFSQMSNSSDTTTITAAIAQAGMFGGYPGDGASLGIVVGTGFTVSNAAGTSCTPPSNITVNGVTYSGTLTHGISFDLSNVSQTINFNLAVAQANVTILSCFQISNDDKQYGPFGISASGTDYILAAYNSAGNTDKILAECVSGDGTGFAISVNTAYMLEMEYRAGGTHTLRVYGGASYGTLIGTSTCAATGSNNVTFYQIGQNHATTAGSGHLYVGGLMAAFGAGSLTP